MRGTNLPISKFLELAIKAAEQIRYSGICLIIDREAERQSKLLQQVVDESSSLHDITGKDILIIVPLPESAPSELLHSPTYLLDPNKGWEDGYATPGVVLAHGVGRDLGEAFWRVAGEPETQTDTIGGEWSGAMPRVDAIFPYPETKETLQKAITEAASETAHFLGLNERWIPCMSLLTPADKRLFVFRYGLRDELYEFFKRIMERRPDKASQTWLSGAVVATADELGLEAERAPEHLPEGLTGWSYTCYGASSIPRLSSGTN